MKIQFEIKEKMPEIIDEILNSERWYCTVTDDNYGLKRIIIMDPIYKSKTYVDIWEKEIHIKTSQAEQNYRIFHKDNSVTCEYIGEHRGLLNHSLLPRITPTKSINFLYNQKNDEMPEEDNERKLYAYCSSKIRDEFINETMPIPSLK